MNLLIIYVEGWWSLTLKGGVRILFLLSEGGDRNFFGFIRGTIFLTLSKAGPEEIDGGLYAFIAAIHMAKDRSTTLFAPVFAI